MIRKFPLISTVIPVYNVEQYIEETIENIIAQDIGFIDNVEIVLVNDGSTDNSLAICQKYAKEYPNNITVLNQENAGVSAARNNGKRAARGAYIHFLDSDDLISKGAYTGAVSLLESNKKIDFAALKIEFFDGQLGGHPLNYKFTEDRVVSIDKEPEALIIHMATCIMRRSAIAKHKFDSNIQISEDMKFLSDLLLHKRVYGLVSSQTYYYRKRRDGGSAIDGALKNITYYTITPKLVYQYILKQWNAHPYAQHVVMYDLQWRLRQQKQEVLTDKQEHDYKKIITSLLKDIEDNVILRQRDMSRAHIEYALRLRHDGKLSDELQDEVIRKKTQYDIEIALHAINIDGKSVTLEFSVLNGANFTRVELDASGEIVQPIHRENDHFAKAFLGDKFLTHNFYSATISLQSVESIRFTGSDGIPLHIIPKRFSRLQNFRGGYAVFGDYIITNKGNQLAIVERTALAHIGAEIRLLGRILLALRLKESIKKLYMIYRSTKKDHLRLGDIAKPLLTPLYKFLKNIKTVLYRVTYYIIKAARGKRPPIWIISDLTVAAGDNGEAFLRYIKQSNKNDAVYYFAISKDSKDYKRLKSEFGKSIIHNHGFVYNMRFLLSSKVISAHADDAVINPLVERVKYLNDLYTFDFVFLQHGVIYTNLSSWLNRYNKNIALFVVSAQQEYDSLLEYPYYYNQEAILPSGLPRYDLLGNDAKNKLILAPTWRHHLANEIDPSTGLRAYSETFKKSDYFAFYSNLMKNKSLREALVAHNMTAELYLHPAFQAQAIDFESDDLFKVKEFPYDYKTAFSEGSILLTDYSSVMFDFSYLGKPILYTQFDHKTFFKRHMSTEGYFDYIDDGFGPVTHTVKDAVSETIAIIKRDCKRDAKYTKQVEKFFIHRDKLNSQRVYEAIMQLDGK